MLIQPGAPKAPPITPAAKAALDRLADITVPAPVPWTPQTWGWLVLAALVLLCASWLIVRTIKRRRMNRYRVEALAALSALEARLVRDDERATALGAMAALLKRVALAAWPRVDVASLSGTAWVTFLRSHAGRSDFPDDAARLLADAQYQPSALSQLSDTDARRITTYIRQWIEGHRVRP